MTPSYLQGPRQGGDRCTQKRDHTTRESLHNRSIAAIRIKDVDSGRGLSVVTFHFSLSVMIEPQMGHSVGYAVGRAWAQSLKLAHVLRNRCSALSLRKFFCHGESAKVYPNMGKAHSKYRELIGEVLYLILAHQAAHVFALRRIAVTLLLLARGGKQPAPSAPCMR
ncbi:hypothetical protein BGY98DRAFT_586712 [Russula aff. rugulosa BPL654]|nr:hypothetical protein BGY98DRAFT_586712 [Russula aff. rugulosa BPL654]